MPTEPNWSKNIQDSTVCTWFYILALFNAGAAIAGVIAAVYLITLNKRSLVTLVPMLIVGGVGFINAWFLFLVCNRSLNVQS